MPEFRGLSFQVIKYLIIKKNQIKSITEQIPKLSLTNQTQQSRNRSKEAQIFKKVKNRMFIRCSRKST
jgi:hypothetical protein